MGNENLPQGLFYQQGKTKIFERLRLMEWFFFHSILPESRIRTCNFFLLNLCEISSKHVTFLIVENGTLGSSISSGC